MSGIDRITVLFVAFVLFLNGCNDQVRDRQIARLKTQLAATCHPSPRT